jgi:glycosyltransferase involved in cell wall biosynthesis
MNILWVSNAPFVGSGYGVQTDIFTRLMKKDGHRPVIRAFYGHNGPPMMANGIEILPASFGEGANDIITADHAHYQPDATVILYDIWPYEKRTLRSVPLTAWVPIDHDPMPPAVLANLREIKYIWAMSRFGERKIREAGLVCDYVPHGVETDVYKPTDRAAARAKWGIKDDQFFAVTVAANKGWPSRKNIDKMVKAWSKFVQDHPDAILYMHTQPTGQYASVDLVQMTRFYGIPEKNIRFPDLYRFTRNEYTPQILNDLYNAADVFVLPSAGEGFGVPALEAQSAGCPVIVSDFTAQAELCGAGWKIEIDAFDDLSYTVYESEQALNLRPSKIVEALENAFKAKGDQALREMARKWAMQYDAKIVWGEYMLPALKKQVDIVEARKMRTAKRLAARARALTPHPLTPSPTRGEGESAVEPVTEGAAV